MLFVYGKEDIVTCLAETPELGNPSIALVPYPS
ncbi:unnamed protein product, partial [marine sediment metagenome]